jgi:tRNA 2-selenouridine synthase
MSEKLINLEELWNLRKTYPILDARSEGEFAQSHILGAINLPILNNEERKVIGTIYKEEGNEKAVLKGFELVGPRFHTIIIEAIALAPSKKVILYCWRGGMRSQILSWLLSMNGFEVFRLKGGYKVYRSYTFQLVRSPFKLLILGGKTGTGKTVLLQHLSKMGEQVIDLEKIANHKGSAFGGIGQTNQPSVEQFENILAEELSTLNPQKTIWVENESRSIGFNVIPTEFFYQMQNAPLIEIEKSDENRIAHIAEEYANLPPDKLIEAVNKLRKRLGIQRTKEAIEAIQKQLNAEWISNLLIYYDATYAHGMKSQRNQQYMPINLDGISVEEACKMLMIKKKEIYGNE